MWMPVRRLRSASLVALRPVSAGIASTTAWRPSAAASVTSVAIRSTSSSRKSGKSAVARPGR